MQKFFENLAFIDLKSISFNICWKSDTCFLSSNILFKANVLSFWMRGSPLVICDIHILTTTWSTLVLKSIWINEALVMTLLAKQLANDAVEEAL